MRREQDIHPSSPADLARAALRRLAEEGVAPTPHHYRRAYLAVTPGGAAEKGADALLQRLSRLPVAQTAAWPRLREALAQGDSELALETLVHALAQGEEPVQEAGLGNWVARFVREWDRSQAGLSHLKKLQALEALEASPAADTLPLLRATVERWAVLRERATAPALVGEEAATPGAGGADAWRRLWVDALRMTEHAYTNEPGISLQAQDLLRQAGELDAISGDFVNQAHALWDACEHWHALSDQVRGRLLDVFRLLLDNIAELFDAGHWVQGQIVALHATLKEPIDLTRVEQSVTNLKDLLFKQGVLQKAGDDARTLARELIEMVVSTLGSYVESTERYGDQLQSGLRELGAAADWEGAKAVVEGILSQSQRMLSDTQTLRHSFAEAQEKLQEAQSRASNLESELQAVSELIQQDPLTGALNRRGLELAFRREAARCERSGETLCVGMIDLDHFKRINDNYGHDIGDIVLKELVRVLRTELRPSDTIARMGGEEFLLLLPGEDLAQARQTLVRVQARFGTKAFNHPRQPAGIHARFSGGLAKWKAEEKFEDVYTRADQALLHAKDAGRNRIELESES